MTTRTPFSVGELYHCYNRGVDKRTVFETADDYNRFLVYLYANNGTKNVKVSDLPSLQLEHVLANENIDRGEPLVELCAYSLMPSHPHLIVREIREGGISTFMQKTFTGYTMFFNKGRERTGALFAGSFKAKHIKDDLYLKTVVPYVLLNPVELFEPRWKLGAGNLEIIEQKLRNYPYSSLNEFLGSAHSTRTVTTTDWREYYEERPTVRRMLESAQEYYREHSASLGLT